jgi:hypothetical protein
VRYTLAQLELKLKINISKESYSFFGYSKWRLTGFELNKNVIIAKTIKITPCIRKKIEAHAVGR